MLRDTGGSKGTDKMKEIKCKGHDGSGGTDTNTRRNPDGDRGEDGRRQAGHERTRNGKKTERSGENTKKKDPYT